MKAMNLFRAFSRLFQEVKFESICNEILCVEKGKGILL